MEKPDVRSFCIRDYTLRTKEHTFPLFTYDERNGWLINVQPLEKYLYSEEDNVEISLQFTIKDGLSGAYDTFKPSEIMVHVGGSTITGKKKVGTDIR